MFPEPPLKTFSSAFLSILFTLTLALGAPSDKVPFRTDPFKNGDTVCWVGDSITHGGSYHSQIELFYATRFPNLNITYFNCGIGGDRASGIMERAPYRLTNDILSHKPTVATIMLGMNDIQRTVFNDPKVTNAAEQKAKYMAVYETNMQALIQSMQSVGARVILCTPSIYDETAVISNETRTVSLGASEALKKCADLMKAWSVKYKTQVVDFQDRMLALNAAGQKKDPMFTVVGKDRIHPGDLGHLIMAYGFLKDTGMTSLVSHMALDGAKGAALKETAQADLSSIKVSKDGLSFEALEKALPFPVSAGAAGALDLIPFTKELNQELLTVKNLAKGKYRLSIDDTAVGEYEASELAAGINLAVNTNTPQYLQAAEIMKSNEVRRGLVNTYRGLVSLEYNTIVRKGIDPVAQPEKALALIQGMIDDATKKDPKSVKWDWKLYVDLEKRKQNSDLEKSLVAYIQKAKMPVKHKFQLTPVK